MPLCYVGVMAWVYLLIAGLLETVWVFAMKSSQGFTRPGPTALTVVAMLGSLGLLGLAMKSLPMGTSYAVWTGIGAAGAVLAGILFLHEPAQPARLVCLALILAGILGLKLVSA